jgi:hypothetical protein
MSSSHSVFVPYWSVALFAKPVMPAVGTLFTVVHPSKLCVADVAITDEVDGDAGAGGGGGIVSRCTAYPVWSFESTRRHIHEMPYAIVQFRDFDALSPQAASVSSKRVRCRVTVWLRSAKCSVKLRLWLLRVWRHLRWRAARRKYVQTLLKSQSLMPLVLQALVIDYLSARGGS